MTLTYILPICGIDFPRDIAFFSVLSKTFLRPDLIICGSGGCIVSYLAMMSGYTDKIENWNINSNLFIYKAVPIFPRLFSFFIIGSLYRRPNIDKFIQSIFIESKLKDTEIITGYFSEKKGRMIISSNLSKDISKLNETNFDLTKTDVEYCDGDLMTILKSIESTTNIPYILPPIGDGKNIDFGIHSPSPLTFMRNTGETEKVIYFAPINIEKT